MPVFHEAGPDAKARLMATSKGFQQRQVYRDNLGKLSEGQIWEVEPESEETEVNKAQGQCSPSFS
jgi:hypothetical protein